MAKEKLVGVFATRANQAWTKNHDNVAHVDVHWDANTTLIKEIFDIAEGLASGSDSNGSKADPSEIAIEGGEYEGTYKTTYWVAHDRKKQNELLQRLAQNPQMLKAELEWDYRVDSNDASKVTLIERLGDRKILHRDSASVDYDDIGARI